MDLHHLLAVHRRAGLVLVPILAATGLSGFRLAGKATLVDRLGLDGGSARTGYVTGAEIEAGRYRIFRAGTLMPNADI